MTDLIRVPLRTSNGTVYVDVDVVHFEHVEGDPYNKSSSDDYYGYVELEYEVIAIDDCDNTFLTLAEESQLTCNIKEYLLTKEHDYYDDY